MAGEILPPEIPELTLATDEEPFRVRSIETEGLQDSEFHKLMLHAVPHLLGSPGIVLYEKEALAGPCKCVEYAPGKKQCFVPGIIGALSDKQEEIYCKEWVKIESPKLVRRLTGWRECVEKSKAAMPPTDGLTRLGAYLTSMSECLKEAGIHHSNPGIEDIKGKDVEVIGPKGSSLIGKRGKVIAKGYRELYDDMVYLVEFTLPVYPGAPTKVWHLREQLRVL